MCGKGTTQTTSSSSAPPKEVMQNYKWVTDLAKQFESGAKFTPYTGEMVAGLTPTQEAGIANVNAAQGMSQPYYQAGAQYAQAGAQGRTPEFSQGLVNQYMSPYIQNVADTTFANLNEMNAQQQQQVLGSSIGRGAYGGDRAGIAQAELARQQGLATGATMGSIYQGGYGQALGQLNQNIAQNQADAVRQLQAGQMLGQLGSGAQTSALEGAKAQISAGANQQAVRQAQDVANQQQFQAAQQFPYQNLSWLANLLSGVGSQMGGTSSTTSPGPSVGSQVLGGIMSLASIPWSDKRLKHDIHEVGKTHDGQPIYTFKYNGDDMTHMGLMAQDVEKKHPDAVATDRGYKKVDYDKATEDARVHKYHGGLVSSQGGVVNPEHQREGYASAGVIPYSTQPNPYQVLTLDSIGAVPAGAEVMMRGSSLPKSPKAPEDAATKDITKGLQAMSPQQRATMAANIDKLKGVAGLAVNVDPKTGVAPVGSRLGAFDGSGNSPTGVSPVGGSAQAAGAPSVLQAGVNGIGRLLGFNMNEGGVVGRKGYADGSDVAPTRVDPSLDEPPTEVPAAQAVTATPKTPTGIVRDSGETLGEKIFGYQVSPEARMGLMAAGLGMMAGRSPFFGVNVGEGALGGLNTYYNALKNQKDYDIEQQKLGLEGKKVGYEGQRVGIAGGELGVAQGRLKVDEQKQAIEILGTLRTRAQAYLAAGQEVPEWLNKQIDDVSRKALGTTGGTPSPDVPAPNASPQVGGTPSEAQVIDGFRIPPNGNEPTVTPQTGTPRVEGEPQVSPATSQANTVVAANDQFTLPPSMDPDALEAQAVKAAASGYPEAALTLRERANKIREQLDKEGGIYINGKFNPVPNYAEAKGLKATTEERMKAMAKNDEEASKAFRERQKSGSEIDSLLNIMSRFQTGTFAKDRNSIIAGLSDLGIQVPESAQNDPAAFQEFMKGTYKQLFENLGSLGGRILVSEIAGLSKASAGGDLTPQANAKILGDGKAIIKYEDDYMKDYAKWRNTPQGRNATSTMDFDLDWTSHHDLNKYKAEAARQIAYQGQKIPTTQDELRHGQRYMYNGQPLYWDKNAQHQDGTIGGFVQTDPLAGGQ